MIGNDIVDLKLTEQESNWKRRGFLQKLFTSEEQAYILNSANPFLQVWLFWSMKEAAYKCYVQQYQKRFFSPTKFQCTMLSKTKGKVTFLNETYYTASTISLNYIHTISSIKKTIKLDSSFFFIENPLQQHKITNTNLINRFLKKAIKKPNSIQLIKNEWGVPAVYFDAEKMNISFSTSHHGNYGGFAILS